MCEECVPFLRRLHCVFAKIIRHSSHVCKSCLYRVESFFVSSLEINLEDGCNWDEKLWKIIAWRQDKFNGQI